VSEPAAVAVRAAVEDGAARGAHHVREARSLAALVAETAFERRPDPVAASFGLEYPRSHLERRAVAGVASVTARELDHPFAGLVEAEADDLAPHQRSSSFSAAELMQ
jgi:hypothetical protein